MSSNRFRRAGYLAMTSAILSIPFLLISYQLSENTDVISSAIQAAMQIVGLFLFIYLTATLKRFLNVCHSFHEVDDYIDFMITTNLIFSLATVAALFLPSYEVAIDRFCLILIVVFGVVQVLFGLKILRAPDTPKGMLKPYSIFTIATGVLIATLVFLPVGVITGAISDVMLGTIFFQTIDKAAHSGAE